LRATQQNADEIKRLGKLFELLTGELGQLGDAAFALRNQPTEMENGVRQALALQDQGLQEGLAKLDGLLADFAVLRRQHDRTLEGVEEMRPILRRLEAVLPFLEEWQRQGAAPAEVVVALRHRQMALAGIQERNPGKARAAVQALDAGPRHGDTLLFKAGIALVEHDFHAVQSELGALVRRRPNDAEMVELHRRATVIATGITPRSRPAPDDDSGTNLQVGDVLDGWTLEARLGSGGWGQVFKAARGAETVALKVMHSRYSRDRDFVARFRQEIMVLSRLPLHPNLLRILDFNNADGRWYLMTEYIDGPTLEKYLLDNGPLKAELARQVFGPVAEGLGQAHAAGIYHRDIKPGNLIFRRKDQKLVVVDFGLAVHAEHVGQTRIGGLTLLFGSPEQTRGAAADARSDVFSLAATIYFALLHDKPDLRNPLYFDAEQVPETVRAVLVKAMETNPRRRYADCRELHAALAAKPATPPLLATPIHVAPPAAAPTKKSAPPREIVNSLGKKMVLIPAGKFLMGSPDSEDGRQSDEGPQHEVEITRPFYLGVYQVTQDEYQRVMGSNPSYFSANGGGKGEVKGQETGRFPVEDVSWRKAVQFCRKLSELPEEKCARRNYRLPTEAEWEYACRAGTGTAFSFGNSLSSKEANFDGDYPYGAAAKARYLERTTVVGSYQGNAFGLFDMHGNVWEWCADWYDAAYYATSPKKDPEGSTSSAEGRRVLRGGSWDDHGVDCRAAYRYGLAPADRINPFGFRLACSVSP
jgi:formylglycine-generating enzyme required for sulfatase activity